MNSPEYNDHLTLKQKHRTAISKNYYWDIIKGKPILRKKVIKEVDYDPEDINVKIEIYEDRVKEWFLEIAERLKKDNEAGFVILQIGVSYIEGNQQLREGKTSKRQSEKFFIKGMRRIFDKEDVPEEVISHFYKQVRCGLFHNGMTGEKVFISGQLPKAISVQNNVIYINPHKFLDKIKEDLERYVRELEAPHNKQLRKNFEKMFYFGKED